MSAGAAALVAAWRRRLLERAGYPAPLAVELAADERFDVAALVSLAERGCPPALARRIVAPLDQTPPPSWKEHPWPHRSAS
ncbi:MAG TPA: hypothetical protein VFG74_17350 [Miltoncostaeaceae bacterium]|jgi:hypothetical protein|nr:hypothetical protein [Miltoncostaeaceae bacterium]